MFRGARPLKRWRYVGVFCEELMACAALARVGPARQSFWAVYPRAGGSSIGGSLRERTHLLVRRGVVELPPGRMAVRDGGVLLDLALEEHEGIQARCRHGHDTPGQAGPGRAGDERPGAAQHNLADEPLSASEPPGPSEPPGASEPLSAHEPLSVGGLFSADEPLSVGEVWTRKQAGVRAHGTLALDGGPAREVQALAVIDDTAGYHARRTEWWWSAGVGTSEDGVALAWNLVAGVNDPPSGSERAVWVDGEPSEPAPVRFADDLSEIVAHDGSRLSFAPEAVRRRSENLLIVRSDYTAPFGAFSGALPGGVRLASGLGVIEHHRARW